MIIKKTQIFYHTLYSEHARMPIVNGFKTTLHRTLYAYTRFVWDAVHVCVCVPLNKFHVSLNNLYIYWAKLAHSATVRYRERNAPGESVSI